jgi:hypothetical protein
LYIIISSRFKYAGDSPYLIRFRFHKQGSAGTKERRGLGDNTPDKVKTVFPAVQGKRGFPPYFRGKCCQNRCGDIGRITDDKVESDRPGKVRYGGFVYAVKEIAFDEDDG